jgi:hypothetical protein
MSMRFTHDWRMFARYRVTLMRLRPEADHVGVVVNDPCTKRSPLLSEIPPRLMSMQREVLAPS